MKFTHKGKEYDMPVNHVRTMKFDPMSKDPVDKSKRRQGLKRIDRKWSAATRALKNKQK